MFEHGASAFAARLRNRLDPQLIVDDWTYATTQATAELILPDGCRDAILTRDRRGRFRLFFSPLGERPEVKAIAPGTAMAGVRLAPGALGSVDGAVRGPLDAAEAVMTTLTLASQLTEALEVLRFAAGPQAAARALGVSLRTLQRLTTKHCGKPPGYWTGLGRARRAARRILLEDTPLCELAVETGFSDQSHMTRETGRWFSASPQQIRDYGRKPDHPLHQLVEPGCESSMDTGEQISTK